VILADENIDRSIITALRGIGLEVYSIAESASDIEDFEVIELSRNPPRIILTEDKDFGEWVFAHHVRDVSVLFLRYDFKDTAQITAIVLNLLQTRLSDLTGKFTTVTISKIRIRSLP